MGVKARPAAVEAIRQRVNDARKRQQDRFGLGEHSCNAQMGPAELREFCRLDEASTSLMQAAFERLGLTARSYDRILKVARTVADLDGSEQIGPQHIAEAIRYRTFRFDGTQP